MSEEIENVPSAEASAPEPLTLDSALEVLNAQGDEQDQTPATTEEAEAPEVEDAAPDEVPDDSETESNPDATEEPDEYAHGNTRTRLRDGTVTTVGELKKAAEQAREYQRQLEERSSKDKETEARLSQIAAQEAYYTNTITQAKAILQANFPPKPDEALLNAGDSFTYMEQKLRYDAAVEKWRGLDQAQKRQAHEAEQKRADEKKAVYAREFEALKEKLPEARDETTFKAFRDSVMTNAPKAYGFSAEEINGFEDHRIFLVIKDALAHRKTQAEKQKALAKAAGAPPVTAPPQAPGRRVAPAEKAAQSVKEGFNRLRQTRSVDDALDILNLMEK